jgi:hypothetical protein
MSRTARGLPPWFVRRLKAVLAVYVLAAALLPLSHHDIVCHSKSATHCSTCVVGASGETAGVSAHFAPIDLTDAGDAISWRHAPLSSLAFGTPSGRAPPVR